MRCSLSTMVFFRVVCLRRELVLGVLVCLIHRGAGRGEGVLGASRAWDLVFV